MTSYLLNLQRETTPLTGEARSNSEGTGQLIFNNPVDLRAVKITVLTGLFCLSFLIAYGLYAGAPLFIYPVAIPIVIAVFYFGGLESEYVWRPYRVDISDDGLTLHFRFGDRTRFVRWEDIQRLPSPPGDPAKQDRYYGRDGYLWLGKRRMHPLHWPIAIAARDKYRERVGRYPPT